ncbi:PTS glucose transporter subunit IIA [Paenibacillus sp. IHB B 3084]|uniref:PTS sugar transporter subunit IIA n=1 Tax=unclassified Paenibacillus TaxID=185978 RepID=UPI0007208AB1|nr:MULTISPECIES: PTS glucose transporter subunit IIA [unclassified Paenibacillus]ALP36662.1 PTS glucose transporter subunit IIA [Paenibacillus sp. IHB B 3084]MBE0339011.1 PTS glucose transporter subunit IIA [Paenibacillus sp. 23TSA30-6]
MFKWLKKKATPRVEEFDIAAPIKGQIVSLAEVPDPAFSTKAMGDGIAIHPSEGKVTAPFTGKVVHVMEKSKHALILEHECGVQVLVHVGINTVSLKGQGFNPYVQTGDNVKAGQLLMEFDMDSIQQAELSLITPVIVPDGQEMISHVEILQDSSVSPDAPVLRVHLKG